MIETNGMLRVDEAFHRKLSKSELATGDVVVVRTGYPGTAAVVPSELDGSNCADLVVITPGDDLNPHVLAAVFNSSWGRSAVGGRLVGAAQQHFNIGSAKLMRLNLPSRSEQDQIAEVLCTFHDLIENHRRRVEMLEEMARAIYREWFVRFRYPGHEDVPLVDSPLSPIPESWAQGVLGDLAEIDRKNIQPSKSPEELFDHYSIPAFDNGQRPAVDVGATIKSGKYLLSSQAVLVSKLNPRIDRVWFADPSEERRSVCSTEFLVLRPTARSSLDHLYLLSRDAVFRNQLTALSGGTSGSHQRAKPKDFLNLPVQVPPTDLVRDLDDAVGDQLRCARLLRCQSEQVACLRDLLLPKLVTGQIDVSHLDIDALTEAATA